MKTTPFNDEEAISFWHEIQSEIYRDCDPVIIDRQHTGNFEDYVRWALWFGYAGGHPFDNFDAMSVDGIFEKWALMASPELAMAHQRANQPQATATP